MADVVIIGDGPSGLAAAITLKRLGKAVTVMQRQPNQQPMRAGESLTSSALLSIKELGLLNEFIADEHSPCYGNCSSWGNNKLSYYDFIQSAMGNGWYINRPKFNHMLYSKAKHAGVAFINAARTVSLHRNQQGNWHYHNGILDITAPIIIDAGGRNSWFSRQLGIKRTVDDQQVAVMMLLDTNKPLKSVHSTVEAVNDGWWYVAAAGDKTVCVFFTDPDLHQRADLQDVAYWNLKKEETLFIKHRVPNQCYKLAMPLQLTPAGGSSLTQFSGPGWLATGDAACTMDPLAAHGIAFALRSGIDAALTASQSLAGSTSAVAEYDKKIGLAIQIYQSQRNNIYLQENRWPAHPYWQRRQTANILKSA